LISSFWTSEGWVQLNVEDAKDVSMVTNWWRARKMGALTIFWFCVCGEFDIFGVGFLDTNEEGHGVDHTQE